MNVPQNHDDTSRPLDERESLDEQIEGVEAAVEAMAGELLRLEALSNRHEVIELRDYQQSRNLLLEMATCLGKARELLATERAARQRVADAE